MSYTEQTWVNGPGGGTPLRATRLNHLEDGVEGVATKADTALQAASNLSDVASQSTARTNLGLGTAATHAATDFLLATNNLSDLPTPAAARTNLGLGTAATHAAADFLQAANNLSDLSNAGTARTNLGLGSVDNTADTAKPVSTAQQTALDLKANLASPTLTGVPLAPTASPGNNSTQIATTAYADAAAVTTITAAETMRVTEIGGLVRVDIASGSGTITTPTSGAGSLPVGWSATYQWVGTIQPVFAAGSGATISNNATGLKIAASGQAVTVICIASNTYTLIGALAA